MKTLFKGFCFLAVAAVFVVGQFSADHKQTVIGPHPPFISTVASLFMPKDANANSLCTACPACSDSRVPLEIDKCRDRCQEYCTKQYATTRGSYQNVCFYGCLTGCGEMQKEIKSVCK